MVHKRKLFANNWMNYTDNKLCFKTVDIHFILTSVQRADYRLCFTSASWCFY